MDMDDLLDWLRWGLLACVFIAQVLAVLTLVFTAMAEVIYRLGRRRRHSSKTPAAVDRLLESIPAVPYEGLVGGAGGSSGGEGDGDDRDDACVICQATYEVGERCVLVPPCKHVFHRACIAAWLRKRVTCPLFRAKVVGVDVVPERRQLNVPENMV